jgi:hypothetical protein
MDQRSRTGGLAEGYANRSGKTFNQQYQNSATILTRGTFMACDQRRHVLQFTVVEQHCNFRSFSRIEPKADHGCF